MTKRLIFFTATLILGGFFMNSIQAQGQFPLLDSIVEYRFSGQDSVPYWKTEFKYDQFDRVTAENNFMVYPNTNHWSLHSYKIWSFDHNGQINEYVSFQRNAQYTGGTIFTRNTYDYSLEGLLRQSTYSYKISEEQEWALRSKIEYLYNAKDLDSVRYQYNYSNNDTVGSIFRKTIYTYDQSFHLISISPYSLNSQGEWYLIERDLHTFDYDAEGRLTMESFSRLEIDYMMYYLHQYTYPTNDSIVIDIFSRNNPDDDEFTPFMQKTRQLDLDGQIIAENIRLWSGAAYDRKYSDQTWEFNEQNELTQTTTTHYLTNPIETVRTTWGFNENGQIRSKTNSRKMAEEWVVESKANYHYEIATGLIKPTFIPKDDFMIYPNPTSGFIRISGEINDLRIRIFTLFGNPVKTIDNPDNEIDLSFLSKGSYLLIVERNGQSVHQQIVIRQ